MMNTKPFFSIVIPAYKAKFLGDAIASCLQQSYSRFELVIVNDSSPENLDEIVGTFRDERIRYYVNEKNCGAIDVVDNWNKCLAYANGDYIICMGDDDRLLPECLEEYVKLINKYPGLGVYHAWSEIINERSEIIQINDNYPEWESALSFLYHRWKGRKMYIGDFCYDVKDLRLNSGFYKLPMAWGSDDISAFRAALSAGIAHTRKPLFQYRVNAHTITNSGNARVKVNATNLYEKWIKKELCNQDAKHLSELDALYLQLLIKKTTDFFRSRRVVLVKNDIKESPLNVFYWLKHHKEVNLSISYILYLWIVGMKLFLKSN